MKILQWDKMLLYAFLVFGTWTGVLGRDAICDRGQHEVCALPDDWSVPANEADVDRMCPIYLQHLDCMNDYAKKCRSNDEDSDLKEAPLDNYRNLAEEACQKDTQLHSRILANIGCLHETITDDLQACHTYLEEKRGALTKHMETISTEKGIEADVYDEEIWSPYGCLVHALETVCLGTKSNARCGSGTKDLVFELVGRSGFIQLSCDPVNEGKLTEYIAVLDLELEEKAALNQILGGK